MPSFLKSILCFVVVTVASYSTYFVGYDQPAKLFWDESYHIASAQRYLHGVHFMEPHPPLGKLLIALGEGLFDADRQDDAFVAVEQAKSLPADFSARGYRFFPTLFAWLCAPLFFLLLLRLTKRPFVSFVFALCYVFDNAIIVHSRGAMLDGIQLFFILVALYFCALLYDRAKSGVGRLVSVAMLAGAALGAALATKVTALIVLVAFVPVVWALRRSLSRLATVTACYCAGCAFVLVLVWQIHFSIATHLQPELNKKGLFSASGEYAAMLREGRPPTILNFPGMLRDSVAFVAQYQAGVPKLNLCKQNENGSAPLLWPFGARSINYRWDKKDGKTSYLFLQVNPVVSAMGLVGLLLGIGCLMSRTLFGAPDRGVDIAFLGVFLLMWFAYMGIMLRLDRVMYLYHYFVSLMFALTAGAIGTSGVAGGLFERFPKGKLLVGCSVVVALVAGFRFYAPLTYGQPLTDEEVQRRALVRLWDLRCAGCDLVNPIARPVCDPNEKRFPQVNIGGIVATDGYQAWGDPKQNVSVDGRDVVIHGVPFKDAIGVHARSVLKFPINGRFSRLTGSVGLPDYLLEAHAGAGSVVFEVLLDGNSVWHSDRITSGQAAVSFTVPLHGAKALELRVEDGGDGIDSDHAIWAGLTFDKLADTENGLFTPKT